MGKLKATEKDVKFAMTTLHEVLIKTIRKDGSGKYDYTLSPSNHFVPEPLFHKLNGEGFFEVKDAGLFDNPQSYVARAQ